jgi:predicted ferric reductase
MAIVKKYKSEIVDIQRPFSDIYVVSFKSLERPYKYLPGQFLHLALDPYDPSCAWPESRCFSMQTNDSEEFIKITYSVKGAFTHRMAEELSVGKEVWLKLPYGELFSLSTKKENVVFIAGGTGITPFLSLFTCMEFSSYVKPKLYLGVKEANYHIYKEELDKAQNINPTFSSNIVYQDKEGLLEIEKIARYHGTSSIYFISGPPLMIRKFKDYLLKENVNPDNIKTDDWQ